MKRFLLAIAVVLTFVGAGAQNKMNVEMADGRVVGFPVQDVSRVYFDTTEVGRGAVIREMQLLKEHIADCNNALASNFKADNFTNLNESLDRLLELSLFNDSVKTVIRNSFKDYSKTDLVRLDTLQGDYFKRLSSAGYEYLLPVKFPNVHFTYNLNTKNWDVIQGKDDIQITYPEKDGTLTTISLVPQSKNYVAVSSLGLAQIVAPVKGKVFLAFRICDDYKVNVTRGSETLVSGEIVHKGLKPSLNIFYSNVTDINLNISGYNVSLSKVETDVQKQYHGSASISKGSTNLLSVTFDVQGLSLTNINADLFGKIQVKGEIKNLQSTAGYLHSAIVADDSATIAAYADSLNQNVTSAIYYDNKDLKIADGKFTCSHIGISFNFLSPSLQFSGQHGYESFVEELTQKEIAGVYELCRSFNQDVLFGLVSYVMGEQHIFENFY